MDKKLRRGCTMLGVVTVASGIIVGCGGTGTDNNSSNGTGSNSNGGTANIVWAAGAITHTGMRKELIAAFEKKYPNIHVTLQEEASNTDTTRQELTTSIGAGATSPDVYLGDCIWPAQFGHDQLAKPLNNLFPQDFWNRFSGGLVQGATYNGNIYGAPFFVDTAFLWYRKDLLEKAGLQPPTTWEQLQSEAQTLQQKGLAKYGFIWQGASYEGLTCDFSEYLADAGGSVLDKSGQPSLDTPQANKALNYMHGLITSGVSPKAVTTDMENQSMNLFADGQVAFLRNWSYAWSVAQDATQSKVVDKVGVVPLPTFDGSTQHFSSVGGWDLYVNPHSKYPDADKTFIDFLTGPEGQQILVQHGEIPSNAASAQAATTADTKSPIFKLLGQISFVSRPDQTPNYPQLSQALYTSVNGALAGNTSVGDALKKAQQQIQSVTSGGL